MSIENRNPETCDHVPASTDVELTLCWKCGVEIVADPITRLWRPLTDTEKLVKYETIRQLRELFVYSSDFSRILFERLEHRDTPAFRLLEGVLGRWIIVSGNHEDLAWSGSRWVPHRHGFPTAGVQICNFETREEALAYANEHFKVIEL